MKPSSFLGKIAPVLIWIRMVLIQIITWVYKAPHLDIPTKYQYLTGVAILIFTGGFFNTIIDAHCIDLHTVPTLV